MKILLDTPEDLNVCRAELKHDDVGQLLTPLTRRRDLGEVYAIDNGAFAGFNETGFMNLLKRQSEHKSRCIFVAVPDIVGSARRTLEVFKRWHWRMFGWPLAFVAQDGINDVEIPWDLITAIFIGGTNEFKLGNETIQVIRAAQALRKWVHVGRVNTPNRFEYFENLGVDSIDGTGISRYSHMRAALKTGTPLLDRENEE